MVMFVISWRAGQNIQAYFLASLTSHIMHTVTTFTIFFPCMYFSVYSICLQCGLHGIRRGYTSCSMLPRLFTTLAILFCSLFRSANVSLLSWPIRPTDKKIGCNCNTAQTTHVHNICSMVAK